MIVELTCFHLLEAIRIGGLRHVRSIKAGRKDNHGLEKGAGWQIHIYGAIGEMVFSKYKKIPWEAGIDTFKAPDVGEYQVRFRQHPEGGLILRKGDNPDEVFYLVVPVKGSDLKFRVAGSILAKDGMVADYWDKEPNKSRPPCWTVPQDKLVKPVEE